MRKQLKHIPFLFVAAFVSFFLISGMEPAYATEANSTDINNDISMGTWYLISLSLAIFGFKFRSKSL